MSFGIGKMIIDNKINLELRLTLRYLHGVNPARLRNVRNGYATKIESARCFLLRRIKKR